MDAVDQTQAREESLAESFRRFGAAHGNSAHGNSAHGNSRYARNPEAEILATGFCLYCGEALDESADRRPQDNRHPQDKSPCAAPQDRRWCSPECRDDWQRLDDALKRKGQ